MQQKLETFKYCRLIAHTTDVQCTAYTGAHVGCSHSKQHTVNNTWSRKCKEMTNYLTASSNTHALNNCTHQTKKNIIIIMIYYNTISQCYCRTVKECLSARVAACEQLGSVFEHVIVWFRL